MSLTQTSAQGMVWVSINRIISQGLTFVSTIVLARLLLPSDFGLVAMSVIVIGFVALINELGLAEAIVQREHIDENHMSTAFWCNLAFSFSLVILTILVAPFIVRFFDQPELQMILQVACLGFVIGAFGSIHRALFIRKMQFKIIAIASIVTAIISVLSTVALAWFRFGYWALVFGSLIGTVTESCLMWILNVWRPKLLFNKAALEEMLRFSLNLLGCSCCGICRE